MRKPSERKTQTKRGLPILEASKTPRPAAQVKSHSLRETRCAGQLRIMGIRRTLAMRTHGRREVRAAEKGAKGRGLEGRQGRRLRLNMRSLPRERWRVSWRCRPFIAGCGLTRLGRTW